jgi:hypothetical protein
MRGGIEEKRGVKGHKGKFVKHEVYLGKEGPGVRGRGIKGAKWGKNGLKCSIKI